LLARVSVGNRAKSHPWTLDRDARGRCPAANGLNVANDPRAGVSYGVMDPMTMRHPVLTCFVLLTLAGCAMAQPSTPPTPAPAPAPTGDGGTASTPRADGPLSPDSPVDAILDALDARGKSLNDFTADVSLAESDPTTGLDTTRIGSVKYQKQGPGDARLRVTFDKKKTDRGLRDEKLEYVLDDGWLVDRNYRSRVQVRRQVLRPGEQIDLLKLGEGPFPLPLGQAKEDVHRQFEVTKQPAGENPPPNTAHVRLAPKPDTQFADKFKSIDVWVDVTSQMPRRIVTVDAGDTGAERTTDLEKLRVNAGLKDEDFELKPVGSDQKWQLQEEPYRD
jgi:outer membrane lipoprotein-sorting protein